VPDFPSSRCKRVLRQPSLERVKRQKRCTCGATGGILLTNDTCTSLYQTANVHLSGKKPVSNRPLPIAGGLVCFKTSKFLQHLMMKRFLEMHGADSGSLLAAGCCGCGKVRGEHCGESQLCFLSLQCNIKLKTCSSPGGNPFSGNGKPAVASGADAVTPWHVAFSELWCFKYNPFKGVIV
jgi:hypothetical protein